MQNFEALELAGLHLVQVLGIICGGRDLASFDFLQDLVFIIEKASHRPLDRNVTT